MARVQEIKPEIDIRDNAERIVTINMTQEQVMDALITWLRLKGVKLPSQCIDSYYVNVHSFCSHDTNGCAMLKYTQKL